LRKCFQTYNNFNEKITLLGWSKNFFTDRLATMVAIAMFQYLYHYNEADIATMSQQVIKITEHATFNRLTKELVINRFMNLVVTHSKELHSANLFSTGVNMVLWFYGGGMRSNTSTAISQDCAAA
jgi:hypothetical protein